MYTLAMNILLPCLLLLISCTTGRNYQKEHLQYIETVKEAQEKMSKADLEKWLQTQLSRKEQEFAAYGSLQDREKVLYSNDAQRFAETRELSDSREYRKRTTQMQMYRYTEKRKYIEKELFLIKTLLSKFASPFVPN